MPTGLELARLYKAKGFAPLPVALGTKECRLEDWPNRVLTEEQLTQHFTNGPENIAVLLGDPSGGLVDIDLDCPEAIKLAPTFLPATNLVFGRPSKRASHLEYKVKQPGATKKFVDPVTKCVLAEYRANHSCTVFPGSVHPSGEAIAFDLDGDPAVVDREDLLGKLRTLVVATVLARYWPNGNRHDAALALAGCLLSNGYDQARAQTIMEAICFAAADEEVVDRITCVHTTSERIQRGERVLAGHALDMHFNPEVARYFMDWLRNRTGEELVISPRAEDLSADGVTPYSDLSNAERFASLHFDKARYCPETREWLIWDSRRWAVDKFGITNRLAIQTTKAMALEAVSSARRDLLTWAAKSQSARGLRDMLTVAQSKIQVRREKFDRDPWVLNCRNGTVNLRDGKLKKHEPQDWISKFTNVEFSPGKNCPVWMAFLNRAMNEDRELISFLKRAVGYTLTGVTAEQCLFVMLGNGANGKTTFLRVMRSLAGEYAQQTPMDTLMAGKYSGVPNDLARLDGTRFVSAVEAEQGKRLAETKIKQMTGGDPIAARYLYGEFFEFIPMFKLWLATNELPRIDSVDEGTWRRMRVIPFEVTIPPEQRDGALPDKLEAELPGILNWAIEGCLEWRRDGLRPPEKILSATRAYRSDMDVFAQFLDDVCVVELGTKLAAKDLYVNYQEWCHDNGHEPLSQTTFGHRLKTRGFRQVRDRTKRSWAGLRLRNPGEESDFEPGVEPVTDVDADLLEP